MNKRFAYHCTKSNPQEILQHGFNEEHRNGYTTNDAIKHTNLIQELPKNRCFVSDENAEIWDKDANHILKIDISDMELYPDYGRLVDMDCLGLNEDGFYILDDYRLSDLYNSSDEQTVLLANMIMEYYGIDDVESFEDEDMILINGNNFTGEESMRIFGTACIDGKYLTSDKITVIK